MRLPTCSQLIKPSRIDRQHNLEGRKDPSKQSKNPDTHTHTFSRIVTSSQEVRFSIRVLRMLHRSCISVCWCMQHKFHHVNLIHMQDMETRCPHNVRSCTYPSSWLEVPWEPGDRMHWKHMGTNECDLSMCHVPRGGCIYPTLAEPSRWPLGFSSGRRTNFSLALWTRERGQLHLPELCELAELTHPRW